MKTLSSRTPSLINLSIDKDEHSSRVSFHLNGSWVTGSLRASQKTRRPRHGAVMNRSVAATILLKFKNGLISWISLWHFLVHLENLDFYEGLDELNKREIQRTREAYQESDLCAAAAIEKRSELKGEQKTGSLRKSVVMVHVHPAADPPIRVVAVGQSLNFPRATHPLDRCKQPQRDQYARVDRGATRTAFHRADIAVERREIQALDKRPHRARRILRREGGIEIYWVQLDLVTLRHPHKMSLN